jgi:hypothetical protein
MAIDAWLLNRSRLIAFLIALHKAL